MRSRLGLHSRTILENLIEGAKTIASPSYPIFSGIAPYLIATLTEVVRYELVEVRKPSLPLPVMCYIMTITKAQYNFAYPPVHV